MEGDFGEVGCVGEREHSVHVRPRIRNELFELRESGRVVVSNELEGGGKTEGVQGQHKVRGWPGGMVGVSSVF